MVGADDKVETRPIVASQAIGDKWLVTEGLKAGDRVVISGLQKVRPGVQVKAQKLPLIITSKPQAVLSLNSQVLANRSR